MGQNWNREATRILRKKIFGLNRFKSKDLQKYPEYVLLQYKEDSDIKNDLVHRIAMDFPKVSDITNKNILYKFVMKIQTPEILISLGFCVNLLFKNRENRKKEEKSL